MFQLRKKKVAFIGLTCLAAIGAGPAAAALSVDQEQTRLDTGGQNFAIGGSAQQKIAQTFKVGIDGPLAAIGLPLGCRSGNLIVEITRLSGDEPGGAVLERTIKPASDFPVTPAAFVEVALDNPIDVSAGDALALVLRNETGECAVLRPPAGDHYADGDGWFESGPEFAGWQRTDLNGILTGEPGDLAFQTFVETTGGVAGAGGCFVPGFGNVPADPYSGACRCFQDPGGRETRCGALHPDFFIERITPFPLTAGKFYEEIWRFTPLTDIDGPVRMVVEGGGRSKPQSHVFGFKSSRGKAETKSFFVRAPGAQEQTPGLARFQYDLENPADESFRFFAQDISIGPEHFQTPK